MCEILTIIALNFNQTLMKKRTLFFLSIVAVSIIAVGFTSDWRFNNVSRYSPILINYEDLTKSIEKQQSREIGNASKITIYKNYILIVEKYKGVHIFDNSEIGFPKPINFIQILGCNDIAIKDDILYADNSVDLVSINLKNFPEITVNTRLNNAFPEPLPPDLNNIPEEYREHNRPKNSVIIDWVRN